MTAAAPLHDPPALDPTDAGRAVDVAIEEFFCGDSRQASAASQPTVDRMPRSSSASPKMTAAPPPDPPALDPTAAGRAAGDEDDTPEDSQV
jgi:hypothetical protein